MKVSFELQVTVSPYVDVRGVATPTPRFYKTIWLDSLPLEGQKFEVCDIVWTVQSSILRLEDQSGHVRTEYLIGLRGDQQRHEIVEDDDDNWFEQLEAAGWRRSR